LKLLNSTQLKTTLIQFSIIILAVYVVVPRPPLWNGVNWSSAYYDENGKLLRMTTTPDEKFRIRVDLKKISPALIEATLLYEDRYFYYHPGINPFSIFRAFYETYIHKSRQMGGSTITMQLARLRYHLKTNHLSGKIIQMLRALQLEFFYNKDEILAAYLSMAPYGQNIEGLAAASLIYFAKTPDRLNSLEALTLSVVPQNPVKNAPESVSNLRGSNIISEKKTNTIDVNDSLVQARLKLYQYWIKKHPEDKKSKDSFSSQIAIYKRKDIPFYAPHFINSIILQGSDSGQVTTTLDVNIQMMISRKLKEYIERNQNRGIENGAAILIDYKNMEVKAMVGSSDFFNDDIHGQVNGANAKRSPGSTLKPFVYALAIDQGIIHSETVLKDSPMGFGAYSPENYDGTFKGPISASDALIRSRNIPAAYLASKIDNPDLYSLLQKAGVKNMESRNHYGLSIVLGGSEITMTELASLYCMLANQGVIKKIKFTEKNNFDKTSNNLNHLEKEERQLISPEAAYITLKMLEKNYIDEGGLDLDFIKQRQPVYWKTGTSFGFRDAWAAGIFANYVLIVWIGNFNGQGNPAFIGRDVAGVLFFRIIEALNAIKPNLHDIQSDKNLNIKLIKVCAASGGLPGPHCPAVKNAYFIPGKSPIQPDTVYREIFINAKTGMRACRADQPGVYRQIYEFWPSDLLKVFQLAGVPRRIPPPYDIECSNGNSGQSPEIVLPRENLNYVIRSGNKENSIAFSAVCDADATDLYWFVDTKYVGRSKRGEEFFWNPSPGNFTVRVIDNQGRFKSRKFKVFQEN